VCNFLSGLSHVHSLTLDSQCVEVKAFLPAWNIAQLSESFFFPA
jgi:hypothetical protein